MSSVSTFANLLQEKDRSNRPTAALRSNRLKRKKFKFGGDWAVSWEIGTIHFYRSHFCATSAFL